MAFILVWAGLGLGCSTTQPAEGLAGNGVGVAIELPAAGDWTGGPIVQTRYGLACGYPDKENTLVWKGLPYARPPVADLRWKAPRRPQPWTGVREARNFGNWSKQLFPFLGLVVGDEDCLYLNVWRPTGDQTGLPVYVWVHGGGNTLGAADMVPDYYGQAVAARSNMVVVSINYRLGPMGWFMHDSLDEEATVPGALPGDGSGNFGTLDIIQSLHWIKQNISAFGGDPTRVTIAGESAGGMNILSLLTSPLAVDLFQAAVIQSGSTRMYQASVARAATAEIATRFLALDGKARDLADARARLAVMPKAEVAAWLRTWSASRIMGFSKAGLSGMTDWPTIYNDGLVLPKAGYGVFRTGDYPVKVPLIIGSTHDETKLFLYFDPLTDWRGERFQALAKYGTERWRAEGTDGIAAALASHSDQPPVWVYRFDWGTPNAAGTSPLPGVWGQRLGAFHSLDVPFFMGTDTVNGIFLTDTVFTAANRAGRQSLSAGIMAWVAALARDGDPNRVPPDQAKVLGLPAWPVQPAMDETAIIAAATNPQVGPRGLVFDAEGDHASYRVLDQFLTKSGIEAEIAATLSPELAKDIRKALDWP